VVEDLKNEVEDQSMPIHGCDSIVNISPFVRSLISTANAMWERAKKNMEGMHCRVMRICFAGFLLTIHELQIQAIICSTESRTRTYIVLPHVTD